MGHHIQSYNDTITSYCFSNIPNMMIMSKVSLAKFVFKFSEILQLLSILITFFSLQYLVMMIIGPVYLGI